MGRHQTRKFAFPGTLSLQDREIIAKPIKQYKEELSQVKALLKEKTRIRKSLQKQPLPTKQINEIGILSGGLRLVKRRSTLGKKIVTSK